MANSYQTLMNAVGSVETAINEVTAVDTNGEVRQLQVGSEVYLGDTIRTGS